MFADLSLTVEKVVHRVLLQTQPRRPMHLLATTSPLPLERSLWAKSLPDKCRLAERRRSFYSDTKEHLDCKQDSESLENFRVKVSVSIDNWLSQKCSGSQTGEPPNQKVCFGKCSLLTSQISTSGCQESSKVPTLDPVALGVTTTSHGLLGSVDQRTKCDGRPTCKVWTTCGVCDAVDMSQIWMREYPLACFHGLSIESEPDFDGTVHSAGSQPASGL